ncbi:hypothetical protein FQA39_LY15523 [Lamprigera yunnana]|nr:hypothetical protein FQA39_LY15523 [Lamprigera yunnana]
MKLYLLLKINKDLISKENVGVLITADPFKPNFDNEISICFLNVNELRDKLGNVQEFFQSVALKIEARLYHIFGRINRLKLVAVDNLVGSSKIKDLLGYVEEFEEHFDDKRSAITKGRHKPGLETEPKDLTETKRVNTHGNIPSSCDNVKGVPVHKWGFTFRGDSNGLSVTDFIERVEEYSAFINA